VSNLHGQRDGAHRTTTPQATSDVTIRPAAGDEIHAALRLILSHGNRRAGDGDVVDFLSFAVQRRIDLTSLWVAVRGSRIVFAALPVTSPGRTMLLLSPAHVPDEALDTSGPALIAELTAHYADRGVQLAQALVDPEHHRSIALYDRCGFHALAELIYLFRDMRGAGAAWPQLPAGFVWERYSSANHARFAQTISASYEGSLDCPALNGVRDIEDVLAGHKAAGEFDPQLWFLLVERAAGAAPSSPGIGRGALLLSRSSRGDALELIYLGLAPAARGRGLGDLMMRQALAAAAATGTGGLSLAVDARNAPALKLYYRYGMQRVASRIAFMRDLSELRNTRADVKARARVSVEKISR
jgi:ribosomal protein S18 acetylase RimI-like enzyme